MDSASPDYLLPDQPPPAKPRTWLWITISLGALLCILLLAVGLPLGVMMVASTAEANSQATATAYGKVTQAAESALAQPPDGWTKVIRDAFIDNRNEWYNSERPNYSLPYTVKIDDGKLIDKFGQTPQEQIYTLVPLTTAGRHNDQFFLAVEARQIGGSTGINAYGLRFRSTSSDDFSIFEIQDNGYFSVKSSSDGQWSDNSPWTRDVSITHEEVNRLAILTDANGYRFFINGHQVLYLTNLSIIQGDVGLIVQGRAPKGVTYEFDNYQLYIPPQP